MSALRVHNLTTMLLAFAIPLALVADEPESLQLREQVQNRPTFVVVGSSFLNIINEKQSLHTLTLDASLHYAVADRWAFGLGIRHGFSSNFDLSSIFTAVDLQVTYAITGTLLPREIVVSVPKGRLVEASRVERGGWRLRASASQFFFNSVVTVYPLSGIGGAVFYDWPFSACCSINAGGSAEFLTNSQTSVFPLSVLGGIKIRL